ncbi:hypothetical protein GLYMA_20G217900v4 [Glycine max]|uniref:Uncharacterized protein n=2 Tax=Glycine subgen. Soja TaxID=1462606 RepID=A0A0R0EFG2_SOYBN|nr:hypothetical protein JHK85_057965 [Glycine max]KAH1037325.1 hypothetical protein GYH30_056632 [Glycine max]KRG92544.1 hypothetical protein GLYMA_20G217900v4 [Glycine max]
MLCIPRWTRWLSKGHLDEAGAKLENAKSYNGNLIKMVMNSTKQNPKEDTGAWQWGEEQRQN